MTQFGPGGFITEQVAVDPASINAGALGTTSSITVQAAREGMVVVPIAPSSLEAGLVPIRAEVTAHKTVSLTLYNDSGSPVNGASRTWTFLLFAGATMTLASG
jgi:hypothetical protein